MTQLKKRMVQLEVLRYDPEKDKEPRFQKYTVECNEEWVVLDALTAVKETCLLYTSPSPRDRTRSRMPSSA